MRNFLSNIQLLQPFCACNDGSRSTMVSAHLTQVIPIENPEIPTVMSSYSGIVGKQNTGRVIKKVHKEDYKKLGVFNLFNTKYLVYIEGDTLKIIDIDYKSKEGFASIPVIEEEDGNELVVRRFKEIQSDYIPSIGVNANVVYHVNGKGFEDAFIISESFANKTAHYELVDVEFIVNSNEYLLDIYEGKDGKSTCLPKVGMEIDKSSRILAVKKVINKTFFNTLLGSSETIHFETDDVFYAKGKVISVSVLKNGDTSYNHQKELDTLVKQTNEDLIKFVNLINEYSDKSFFVSDKLNSYYHKAVNYLDPNKPFVIKDHEFNGYLVQIKVLKRVTSGVGSKITSFHASKGLISKILPDNEMPVDENGVVADVIFNPLSVIGRQNLGQLNEIIVNNILDRLRELLRKEECYITKRNIMVDFMSNLILNEAFYKGFLIALNSKDYIDEFIKDKNFCVPIDPLHIPKRENYKYLMEKYNISNMKNFSINGVPVKNKLTCGRLYMIKLKHEPGKKTTFTSANRLSEKGNQPAKDTKMKKNKSPFNPVPSTCGEMELMSLLLEKNKYIMRELIFAKSADINLMEKFMFSQLTKKDLTQEELFEGEKLEHFGISILREYFKVLGLNLK